MQPPSWAGLPTSGPALGSRFFEGFFFFFWSSFLATFKEVNQSGSKKHSGNPKTSSHSSAGPGGAHAPQRSGLVAFYTSSCERLTEDPQKLLSAMKRDHLLTWPVAQHIPLPSSFLLIISQHPSSPLPALHTPGHARTHDVCPLPWTISSTSHLLVHS